jgi:gliding motility-associated-like protein
MFMRTAIYLFILASTASFCVSAKEKGELLFAKNQTQWEAPIQYKAYLPGGAVFLTKNDFRYSYYNLKDLERIHELKHKKSNVDNEAVHFHAYDVSFVGSNASATLETDQQQPFFYNYFIGSDPKKWASNVPVFKAVTYKQVYAGVDVKVYSTGTSLKYDFIVAPKADVTQIALSFNGVTPGISRQGDLKIKTSVNTITEKAPYCYQLIDGKKKVVASEYVLDNSGVLRFSFPNGFDHSRELIIDPVLVFGTFSGSTATTYGFSAAYDSSGCLYAGGSVFAVGWPVTLGAFQTTFGSNVDAGLNKYSSNGSTLIYSTYYGGSDADLPNNMIVTAQNELVVTGSTSSSDLPTTSGCYDNSFNGGVTDMYVAKFNYTGSALVGATYIGGSNSDALNTSSLSVNYGDAHRGDLLIDTMGNIIVCGSSSSSDFPTTGGAFQTALGGSQDGVVFKLDSTCSSLIFSTFLGGSGDDACFSLAKTSTQQIVVVGGTSSNNFPTTTGALFPAYQDSTDGFVTIINSSGSSLVHSTYLGTVSYDHAFRVDVNPADDHVFVCGQTQGNYPVSPGVYSNPNSNIFIQELSDDLSTAILSTRIGGTDFLVPTAFLYDNCGNIYFCGFRAVANMPLTANAQQTSVGGFWLAVLTPGMSSLLYGSYMGGSSDHVDGGSSRFDPQGIVYHSVCTISGFNTTPSSWAPVNLTGSFDVASFKFNFEATGVKAGVNVTGKDSVCVPGTVQFVNNSVSATNYVWDFGDNSPTSTAATPSHTYTPPGTYHVRLHAYRLTGCITDDTAYYTIYAVGLDKPMLDLHDTLICVPGLVTLSANVLNANTSRSYQWTPLNAITSDPNQQSIIADVTLSNSFTVIVIDSMGSICKESAQDTINVLIKNAEDFKAFGDTSICRGDSVNLWGIGGDFYAWSPDYNISNANASIVNVFPQENTKYTVLISDSAGCEKERDVYVTINPDAHVDAGEDFYLKYGESAPLYGSGAASYFWYPTYMIDPVDVPSPTVRPDVTTTYFVVGTSKEGCKAIDSVTVKVTNTIIPSVFSPNGDGRNDRFYIRPTHSGVNVMEISVYNRWGERVFYTNQTDEGWDGSYKGVPADMGTYFYQLIYSIGRKQYTEKGDVTLVR